MVSGGDVMVVNMMKMVASRMSLGSIVVSIGLCKWFVLNLGRHTMSWDESGVVLSVAMVVVTRMMHEMMMSENRMNGLNGLSGLSGLVLRMLSLEL